VVVDAAMEGDAVGQDVDPREAPPSVEDDDDDDDETGLEAGCDCDVGDDCCVDDADGADD